MSENFKTAIVIFEISTLELVKTNFFTPTENFGIGFASSEASGPGFYEGASPGPSLLDKVCLFKLVKYMFVIDMYIAFPGRIWKGKKIYYKVCEIREDHIFLVICTKYWHRKYA